MCHLSLTDNTKQALCQLLGSEAPETASLHVYEDLQAVAGIPLKSLCQNNPSLLVFPDCLGEHQDGIEGQRIFDLEGRPKYEGDRIVSVENVRVKTGNLMGFIGFSGRGFHGTRVEIRSRFTENSGKDFFLHYMLEKVFKISLFDLSYSLGKNDGFDFVYLLFPHLLREAVRQGVFRQYQTFDRNDSRVRGPLDVGRHIRQNTPFAGKVAYRSRENSIDNPVTQLVRHTIEFIKTKDFGKSLLSADGDTKDAVFQIVAATNETYSPQQRQGVIAKNNRPISHPYYSRYSNLQKLCLLILQRRTVRFAATTSPVYGILFDGAWLWEEYLWSILQGLRSSGQDFVHPRNKVSKDGIRLFCNDGFDGEEAFSKCYRRIYPDFYRLDSSVAKGCILDAKYKRLENSLVRDDLYQIISYMHTMQIDRGGFLYPLRAGEESASLEWKQYKLAGYGGTVSSLGLAIPQSADSYDTFKSGMEKLEEELRKAFGEVPREGAES